MQEIKCPNCGEVFVVDESGYTQIVQQVRDKEFEKELTRREQDLAAKKESELEIARMKQQEDFNRLLMEKEAELLEKEAAIQQLRTRLDGNETEKKLAVSQAVSQKDQELLQKAAEITQLKS